MRLLLNVGMHKTGSSAIQQSLKSYDRDGVRYLPILHPNHSSLYATLFLENPESYPAHRKNSRTSDEVAAIKDKFSKAFEKAIGNARRSGITTLISSGEDVSNLDEGSLIRLRDWADERFSEVALIGYVRAPASFMASALQQRVKGGLPVKMGALYPNYRERFEKFDNVFGSERVTLVKFDRSVLFEGDVVLDFAQRAGASLRADDVVSDNLSRSLETTAVLYAQRNLGRGWVRYPGSPRDNNQLVTALESLGDSRITLHPDRVRKILQMHADDIAWISERVGTSLDDTPETKNVESAISKPDDLLELSKGHLPAILDLIKTEVGTKDVPPQVIANAVDMLLDVIRENNNAQADDRQNAKARRPTHLQAIKNILKNRSS